MEQMIQTLTQDEAQLIYRIRTSEDPAKAMEMVIDILTRSVTGENLESIAASYGLRVTADGKVERI